MPLQCTRNTALKRIDVTVEFQRLGDGHATVWTRQCRRRLNTPVWKVFLTHTVCIFNNCYTLLFQSPVNYVYSHQRQNQFYYRNEIISHFDTNYHLLSHICQNLELYMRNAREACQGQSTIVRIHNVECSTYIHACRSEVCVLHGVCTLHFLVVRINFGKVW